MAKVIFDENSCKAASFALMFAQKIIAIAKDRLIQKVSPAEVADMDKYVLGASFVQHIP